MSSIGYVQGDSCCQVARCCRAVRDSPTPFPLRLWPAISNTENDRKQICEPFSEINLRCRSRVRLTLPSGTTMENPKYQLSYEPSITHSITSERQLRSKTLLVCRPRGPRLYRAHFGAGIVYYTRQGLGICKVLPHACFLANVASPFCATGYGHTGHVDNLCPSCSASDGMSCRRETWFWHRTNDYMMCSNTRVYVCALIDREWHGPPLVYTLRPTWITVGQLDISRATEKSGDSLFGVFGSFWRTVYPSGCYFHSFVRGVLLKAAEQITRQAGAHGPGPALHC